MNFNCNKNAPTSAFKPHKPFLSQLRPGLVQADKENISLKGSGIYERYTQDNVFNNAAIPSETGINTSTMSPHECDSSKMQKRDPFGDKNPSPLPKRIPGKRSHPPEDITTPVSPQKRRRVDIVQAQPSVVPASRSATGTTPQIPALLPIQHDSWYYLPEMWDHRGPDGKPIKARRWSPNEGGDSHITHRSDRLGEDGNRDNATAATVATWVELNRLRARYAELLAKFHGIPLQVHHLADEVSERKMEAMEKASRELKEAMNHVCIASRPQPQFGRCAGLAPAAEQPTLASQISLPVAASPRNTHVAEGLPKAASSARTPAYVALSDILPASSNTPYSPEPPKKAVPGPTPGLPIALRQQVLTAAPLDVTSSTDGASRRRRAPPISDHVASPAVPSTSTGPLYFLATGGQFRFTAAGEARFKLLTVEGKYDEAFSMLPGDQQFEHLTTPDAISAFRLVHPRPEKGQKGEGNAVETELWVCRAKVKIERRELPKVAKSGTPEYGFDSVYSDEPCNGAVSTHCSMVRHKKRTHLGRLYQSSATQKKQGGETGK